MAGCYLSVKVTPKSHKNQITGWENGELKVRLRAIPEKGNANEALLSFLAETLNLPKSSLEITQGLTSRHKRIYITGLRIQDLDALLQKIL